MAKNMLVLHLGGNTKPQAERNSGDNYRLKNKPTFEKPTPQRVQNNALAKSVISKKQDCLSVRLLRNSDACLEIPPRFVF